MNGTLAMVLAGIVDRLAVHRPAHRLLKLVADTEPSSCPAITYWLMGSL